MTDKPSTFDIKFDSAGDFDKARELIERMNATLAAKEAQIDRVRALAEKWKLADPVYRATFHVCADELLAALGKPAATPEREQP